MLTNSSFHIHYTHICISNFHTILEEDINSKGGLTCDPFSWLYETEPAVDLPLQFNFGSPYRYLFSVTILGHLDNGHSLQYLLKTILPSSSLVVFFDFETKSNKSNDLQESRRIKTRDQKQRELGPSY